MSGGLLVARGGLGVCFEGRSVIRSLAYTFPGSVVAACTKERYSASTIGWCVSGITGSQSMCQTADLHFALTCPSQACAANKTQALGAHILILSVCASLIRNMAGLAIHIIPCDAAKHHSSAAPVWCRLVRLCLEAVGVIARTSLDNPAPCFPPQHPPQTCGGRSSHGANEPLALSRCQEPLLRQWVHSRWWSSFALRGFSQHLTIIKMLVLKSISFSFLCSL